MEFSIPPDGRQRFNTLTWFKGRPDHLFPLVGSSLLTISQDTSASPAWHFLDPVEVGQIHLQPSLPGNFPFLL